ncbi:MULTISPECIES: hypothetical protein [unclassified Vibrio]|uniref:hypothetical protein n=1 Tax=unclassified Vibrio TaxID=2614977 RepID=UPI00354B7D7F
MPWWISHDSMVQCRCVVAIFYYGQTMALIDFAQHLGDATACSLLSPCLLLPKAQHLLSARVKERPKCFIIAVFFLMQLHVLFEFVECSFK